MFKNVPDILVVAPKSSVTDVGNPVTAAVCADPSGGKIFLFPAQKGAGAIEIGFNDNGEPYICLSDSKSSVTLSSSGLDISDSPSIPDLAVE